MLRCRQPAYVAWGADMVSLYNDGYLPILGARHPQALGQPAPQLWTEAWETLGPLKAEVMNGRSHWLEDMPWARDGSNRANSWFSFSLTPLLDDDSGVGGLLCLATETTDRVKARRLCAAETERQRSMFAEAPGFICSLSGAAHVFEFVNESFLRLFGGRDFVGRSARARSFPIWPTRASSSCWTGSTKAASASSLTRFASCCSTTANPRRSGISSSFCSRCATRTTPWPVFSSRATTSPSA
ncbi:MAG TPA: PAS domain-containing protein [Pseudoxanthomonas sp.]|nr:PAS domain-containing protein [Pseudoxanthomonas sp.]